MVLHKVLATEFQQLWDHIPYDRLMMNITDKIRPVPIIMIFLASVAVVVLYASIAFCVGSFLIRKKNRVAFNLLLKKALVKLPFLLTGYGFLAGLVIYLGLPVIDALMGTDGRTGIADGKRVTGPEIALVVFTSMGFCISVCAGWAMFFDARKNLSASTEEQGGR
jgi:hypothetical protein